MSKLLLDTDTTAIESVVSATSAVTANTAKISYTDASKVAGADQKSFSYTFSTDKEI